MRSVDTVQVELSGGSFTLHATIAAFVRLEEQHGVTYDSVGGIVFNKEFNMSAKAVRSLCTVAAGLTESAKADDVLHAIQSPEDLTTLRGAVLESIVRFLPPRKKEEDTEDAQTEGGDNAPAPPSESA